MLCWTKLDPNQIYTFIIFQDGRHSILVILFLIVFNMAIGISTVPLFTKFHFNRLYITIAIWLFEVFYKNPTSSIFNMAAIPATMFSKTYTTIMQIFMLLPHFELLSLKSARIAAWISNLNSVQIWVRWGCNCTALCTSMCLIVYQVCNLNNLL